MYENENNKGYDSKLILYTWHKNFLPHFRQRLPTYLFLEKGSYDPFISTSAWYSSKLPIKFSENPPILKLL